MRVTTDRFASAFDNIRQRALKDACSVLILVAADCDALCAYQMLKDMLRAEYIQYKMIPVESQADLQQTQAAFRESDGQIQVVIMINCGGTVPVTELFDLTEEEQQQICFCIIDSHRPLHLDNVYSDTILVFDDGETNIPAPEDVIVSDDEDDGDNDHDEELEEQDGNGPSKRRKWESRVLARMEKQRALDAYFDNVVVGVSSAVLISHLVTEIGQTNNTFLWLASVGLTDQYINGKISSEMYVQHALTLQSEIVKSNSIEEGTRHRGVTLTVEEDAQLCLLRHWTLYDAMVHSRYVVGRIPIWTTKGQERLKHLLAMMGISLQISKQLYKALDQKTKATILEQLKTHGPDYGLDRITFLSFLYRSGYQLPSSASDIVYAVNGILNHIIDNERVEDRVFKALDCLSMQKQSVFEYGVQCAREQETAVLNQVQFVFQSEGTQAIRCHAATVRNESRRFFLRPAMLTKLAHYLVDVRRYCTLKKRRMQQQLVVVENSEDDSMTWVGVWCRSRQREGTVVPNRFPSLFHKVATTNQIEYAMPEFDSNVVQVRREQGMIFRVQLFQAVLKATREEKDAR